MIALSALVGLTVPLACRRDEPGAQREASNSQETPPEPKTEPPSASSEAQATESSDPAQSDTPPSPGAELNLAIRVIPAVKDILTDVEKELLPRWDEIHSVSAKANMTFDRLKGVETHQAAIGKYDGQKSNGKLLIRYVTGNTIMIKNTDEDAEIPWARTQQRLTKVSDGRFLYTMDERHTGTTIIKDWARPGSILQIGGNGLFNLLRSMKDLKRLADEPVNGDDTYVFEGVDKNGRHKIRVFLDKKTGIMRKMVTENETQESVFVLELNEIEFNIEFGEDHFTFTPREGVEIKDLTKPNAEREPASPGP